MLKMSNKYQGKGLENDDAATNNAKFEIGKREVKNGKSLIEKCIC